LNALVNKMTSSDLATDRRSPDAAAPTEAHGSVRARILAGIAAIAGLVASGALVAPYVVRRGLCTPGGGCDQVAHSAYAELFGVPRAFIGVAAFAFALALVVIGSPRARRLGLLSIGVGALAAIEGAHLLFLQLFVIKAICPFCVVADISGLVLGGALLYEALAMKGDVRRTLAPLPFAFGGLAAVLAPITLAAVQPQRPVATITPLAPTQDGRIVLREFVDLQCPFCRATHVSLKKALASRPDVVVERHHVPFPQHEHALGAAVAACCAGEQGKEEAFIDAIVSHPEAPNEAVCRMVALELSLDVDAFSACQASPRPKKRIETDIKLADSTGVEALPTIDMEGERYVGQLDDASAAAFLARHVSH
jgi:protein-disulfide isomerase/uncharacterized membrane protein